MSPCRGCRWSIAIFTSSGAASEMPVATTIASAAPQATSRRCGLMIGAITPPPPPRARAARGSAPSRRRSSACVPSSAMRPSVDDRDAVGERDRRGTVRDHERRPAGHHLRQRGADLVLLRRVDRRGRVVEDQHLRVGEDRARDRDPLPLAAREREAALAEHRLVALGQALDELRGAGEPRGAADRPPRRRPGSRSRRCRCTVSPNRNVSSNTSPTPRRSSSRRSSRTSTPPIVTRPPSGS